MKLRKMIWIGLGVIGAVVLFFVFAVVMTVDDWSRDLSTNVAETRIKAADPLLRPLLVKGTADCAAKVVQEQIASLSRWNVERVDGGEKTVIHATRKTPLWGFVDDIRVTITPGDETTSITVYSKSRLGKGDLGQNPRNIKELMRRLQTVEEFAWKCEE
ncbi:DUF1499 domain-containing protein [Blastopirellula sp. J2-11]|uniref:DUF1499 domain-containing protein n=1 Tax=Blastopirellula sp. J2-11 TaxID=2943192 RepID=UPI0021C6E332|nr:DUF1499 domain-containing protein [Blastopirellula sp. J2-11]UUO07122.1 DUF1499 domain-containing protein [Blastopirellula sp. J2-11]